MLCTFRDHFQQSGNIVLTGIFTVSVLVIAGIFDAQNCLAGGNSHNSLAMDWYFLGQRFRLCSAMGYCAKAGLNRTLNSNAST